MEQTTISPDVPNDTSLPFQVDDWHINPLSSEIFSGELHKKLEPKVMAVLVCLVQQAGKVVTRNQLETTVWAGRVVGYEALASTIIKLRKAFNDNPKQPHIIETIPKKGYRLIAEVTFSLNRPKQPLSPPVQKKSPVIAATSKKNHKIITLAGAALLAVLVAGFTLFTVQKTGNNTNPSNANFNLTAPPSIAVLAFKNMSDDPQQDYFSDGISADLITGLSKISSLSVIARNSTFAYKNTSTDIRIIGNELGARYVVEGSVRKSGENIRISARLIDTSTGYNLWADSFDCAVDDMFSFQDNVTSSIISTLQIKLTTDEKFKLNYAYTSNTDAYDNFLRGWQYIWNFSKDSNRNAREHFLKAVNLDPDFARAYAYLAVNYVFDFKFHLSETSAKSLQLARDNANQAIKLDPNLPEAYMAKGFTEIHAHEYDKAIASMQKGISLNPSFADAYVLLAMSLNFSGDSQAAYNAMQIATQLNPRNPAIFYNVTNGKIAFNLRNYDAAINHFSDVLQHMKNPDTYLWLAAAYAHAGRTDKANEELEKARNMNKALSFKQLKQSMPLQNLEQKQHLIDGLRKAGLSETAEQNAG